MDSPSASVRIKLEKGEVEICGSEEFVSDHLDQLQKFLRSQTKGPEETSLPRTATGPRQPSRGRKSEYRDLHHDDHHRREGKGTNEGTDYSEERADFELPETPEGVFEMWRAHIHKGYISKYLLTTALGYCKQNENGRQSFTVSEIRDLYRTIGTTANVHSDLRKAREKHLIRTVGEDAETPSHQITPLGEEQLRQSFAE